MKNILFFLSLLGFHCGSFAQILTYQTFDFPAHQKIKTDTLGASETKAVVVAEKRCADYIYNKSNELEKHCFLYRKVYIKSSAGIDENNRIYLASEDLSDILFFKARTLDVAGKTITEQFRTDLKVEDDKESGRYYKCAVEGLKPDMFVEYFYLMKVYMNITNVEFIQTHQQKLKVDYEIVSPVNLVFEGKIYNHSGSAFKKSEDTTKNIIFCTLYNIPEKSSEEYSATDANLTRVEYKLAYNYVIDRARRQSWEQAGITYYNIYHKDISESKALQKLIKENGVSKKSVLEKIYFIEQFVKTGIATQEESLYFTPNDILKYRVASSVAIARLMVAYFRELGINYEIYIGSSRLKRPLDKGFDSWKYLETVVFYFPDVDKFMVPEKYELRLGLVPYDLAETHVLSIREMKIGNTAKGLSSIKKLPAAVYQKSADTLLATVHFKQDLSGVTVKLKRKLIGYMANNIRPYYYYSNKDNQEKLIKGYLTQDDDNVASSNIEVENFDYENYLEEVPFKINCDLNYKSLVERSGEKLIFKVGEIIGRQAELYQEKTRVTDIDIQYPHQYIREIKVAVPKGYKAANLSSAEIKFSYKEDNGKELMGFVSKAMLKDNFIVIYIDEHYAFTQLSKSRFEDFRKVINAAADFNKVVLIFEPDK